MTFQLRVNGEPVWETDYQVERVSLQSARGEAGTIGISTEGVVDLIVTEVASGGPARLDHVEMAQRRLQREAVGEGDRRGSVTADRVVLSRDMNMTQGEHEYTLRPGPPVHNDVNSNFPQHDLSQDVDPGDTETLSERVQKFADTGDSAQAIGEENVNPNTAEARQAEAFQTQRENVRDLRNSVSGLPVGDFETENTSAQLRDLTNEGSPEGEGNQNQDMSGFENEFNMGEPGNSENEV